MPRSKATIRAAKPLGVKKTTKTKAAPKKKVAKKVVAKKPKAAKPSGAKPKSAPKKKVVKGGKKKWAEVRTIAEKYKIVNW